MKSNISGGRKGGFEGSTPLPEKTTGSIILDSGRYLTIFGTIFKTIGSIILDLERVLLKKKSYWFKLLFPLPWENVRGTCHTLTQ